MGHTVPVVGSRVKAPLSRQDDCALSQRTSCICSREYVSCSCRIAVSVSLSFRKALTSSMNGCVAGRAGKQAANRQKPQGW